MAIKLCTTLSEEDKAKALKGLRRIARTKEAFFHDQTQLHWFTDDIFKFSMKHTEEGWNFWLVIDAKIEEDFGYTNIIPYGYSS